MKSTLPHRLAGWGLAMMLVCTALGQNEIPYAQADFNKLDQFEAHSLGKADKVFFDKDYNAAAAEYETFLQEFPRSAATSYALLRKARCLHLGNKRFNAIKVYNEVLDYFPDDVQYASAALYYIGVCHKENSDEEKAMKAWAEMADDVDYSKHTLAAYAINELAQYLIKREQVAKAMGYYWQVAVDFRKANPEAANAAIDRVAAYYTRTKPDEPKLREFYDKVKGFHNRPADIPTDLDADPGYWANVRALMKKHGTFNDVQAPQRREYYGYWSRAMAGRLGDADDYQIDLINFQLLADDDRAAWTKRLDDLFARKPADNYARVVTWMGLFQSQREKVKEYYGKLNFEKMDNGLVLQVLRFFYDSLNDPELGRNAYSRLKLDKMTDHEKIHQLARYLWHKDEELVVRTCQALENKDLGRMELLRYYHWRRNTKEAMPLAEELTNVPEFAKDATWMKAEMLHWAKKWDEAIKTYQLADNPPHNLYRIADCFASQGKLDQAVGQLREIENFFKNNASDAALRIAYLYRDAGKRDQYVASLRNVLKKYPKSGESSRAHEELEKLGERIGGGVDADKPIADPGP